LAPIQGIAIPLYTHVRAAGDPHHTQQVYSALTRFLITLIVPLASLQMVLAHELVTTFYSNLYSEAVPVFFWMVALSSAEAILTIPAWNALTVHEFYKPAIIGRGISLIALPLLPMAVQSAGLVGLVIVLWSPALLGAVYTLWKAKEKLAVDFPFGYMLRISALSLLSVVIIVLLLKNSWSPMVRMILGGLIYVMMMYLTFRLSGGLHPQDRALLHEVDLPGTRLWLKWL
jgi:O-antigen/teichoic acid export membrane protein